MGCGLSSPAAPSSAARNSQAAVKSQADPAILSLTEVRSAKHASTTSVSTDGTQPSTSRETTPDMRLKPQHSARSTVGRSFDVRQASASGKHLQANLAGPCRDYTGSDLERKDNSGVSHITALACTIMKVPVAVILLAAEDRMQLVNAHGSEPEDAAWLPTFCAWALGQNSGLVTIEDLATNERTASLPWVREDPSISFYAGATLHRASGERLGVLCVIDFELRPGASTMAISLPNLAEMVTKELQLDLHATEAETMLFRAMDTYWDGSVLVDTKIGRWRIKYANQVFSSMTGIDRNLVQGKDLWSVVEVLGSAGPGRPWEECAAKAQSQEEFELSPVVPSLPGAPRSGHSSGSENPPKRFKISMRPNTEHIMKTYGLAAQRADITGVYFAVFTHLASSSRGSYAGVPTADGDGVPFDGVEMGPIIGKGSFGSVYRAVWSSRLVAIKVIESAENTKVDQYGDPLEAALMLKLKHLNIIETIQYTAQLRARDPTEHVAKASGTGGSDTDSLASTSAKSSILESWLMLEYCDLGSLSDCVVAGKFHEDIKAGVGGEVQVPKMTAILRTARDVALGLEFIHAHHILHGDLTAGNVLLQTVADDEEHPHNFLAKVADFGLSRQTISSKVETNTYGTVTHMPPELLNDGLLSKAADVYAFGVLLYEVYTKKRVWEGLRHPQIIHAIAVQKKHPDLPDTAPQGYKDLAHSCMAAEPEDRPTFAEIIETLNKLLQG